MPLAFFFKAHRNMRLLVRSLVEMLVQGVPFLATSFPRLLQVEIFWSVLPHPEQTQAASLRRFWREGERPGADRTGSNKQARTFKLALQKGCLRNRGVLLPATRTQLLRNRMIYTLLLAKIILKKRKAATCSGVQEDQECFLAALTMNSEPFLSR